MVSQQTAPDARIMRSGNWGSDSRRTENNAPRIIFACESNICFEFMSLVPRDSLDSILVA